MSTLRRFTKTKKKHNAPDKQRERELQGLFAPDSDDTGSLSISNDAGADVPAQEPLPVLGQKSRRTSASELLTSKDSFCYLDGGFKSGQVPEERRPGSPGRRRASNMKASVSSPSISRKQRRRTLIGTVRGNSKSDTDSCTDVSSNSGDDAEYLSAFELDEDSPKKAFNKKNTYLAHAERLDDIEQHLADIVQIISQVKSRTTTISTNQRSFGQRQNLLMDLVCDTSRNGKFFMVDINGVPYPLRLPDQVPKGAKLDPANHLEKPGCAAGCCTII